MSNSSRYVKTNINNSGLIPQPTPSDFPLLISSDGYQSLTQLVPQYIFDSTLYNYYLAQNMPIGTILQLMFEQTQSPPEIWGLDLETTYSMTLLADGSLNYDIQWLDIDNGAYKEFTGAVANLAALEAFLAANIDTCDFTIDTLTITVTPKDTSLNQLVRINLTNLDLTAYSFTASNAPAAVDAAFNALIAQYPGSINFYCLAIEGSIFYPTVSDGDSGKIAAQLALANAVEATQNNDDNRKVMVIGSSDPNILLQSSTTDIMAEVQAAALERTAVAYYNGVGLAAAAVSLRFGLSDGNSSWAYTTLTGITYQFLTDAQINTIYLVDNEGNLSTQCKNGNYYDNSGGASFFYPGITGSGLFLDITILLDHIARDCRYAQIGLENSQANKGQDIPYNQTGINMMVGCIRSVVNGYFQQGLLSPVNAQGDSCIISAPTFAQIQANPVLANQFKNRILTGIGIDVIPAGNINKTVETFTAII